MRNFKNLTKWAVRGVYRTVLLTVLGVILFLWGLANRFAFWLDTWLYPRFTEAIVERPLFVIGPPRSGTTLTHRLLASHSQTFTTFPLWELLFAPALCQKYFWQAVYRGDQILGGYGNSCLRGCERFLFGSMQGIHPTSLELPEEDYLGLLSFGGCFLKVLAYPDSHDVWRLGHFSKCLPSHRKQYLLHTYRGLVQRHLYFRGQTRCYLSKNPSFCSWLPELVDAFPDARFILLERPAAQIVPSQLSSLRGALGFFGCDARDRKIVNRFVNLLSEYRCYVHRAARQLPPDRAHFIEYESLKSEAKSELAFALEKFGYQVTAEDRERFEQLATEARQHRSQHRYRLSDFGLCESDLFDEFAREETTRPLRVMHPKHRASDPGLSKPTIDLNSDKNVQRVDDQRAGLSGCVHHRSC